MSVLLETSLGDLVASTQTSHSSFYSCLHEAAPQQIDLEVEKCPKACENFLKLCKTYAYSFNAFFSVQRDFLAQTGDPHSRGDGGSSIWHRLPSSSPCYSSTPYFLPERPRTLKHIQRGTVSLALTSPTNDADPDAPRYAGSQFFITLGREIEYLDGKHAVIGTVVEGQEEGGTLDKINQAFVDEKMRPLQDIRIRHAEVLDDPFPDPEGLHLPSRTPSPTPSQLANARLDASEPLTDPSLLPPEQVEAEKRLADTNAAALTLEMVGDLPHADVRPPENILFVCKLNPVTRSEDLDLIFSRFGTILSCEVIKDKKTGDSLQYAFIEFDKKEQAEQAYFKMQNVLIDDRRIWVDFSQSVGKLHASWLSGRKGGASSGGTTNYGAGPPGSTPGGARRESATPSSRKGDMVFDFATPRGADGRGGGGGYRDERRGGGGGSGRYDGRGGGEGGYRERQGERDRYDDRQRGSGSGRYERDDRRDGRSGREYEHDRRDSRYRDDRDERRREEPVRRERERSPRREERYRR